MLKIWLVAKQRQHRILRHAHISARADLDFKGGTGGGIKRITGGERCVDLGWGDQFSAPGRQNDAEPLTMLMRDGAGISRVFCCCAKAGCSAAVINTANAQNADTPRSSAKKISKGFIELGYVEVYNVKRYNKCRTIQHVDSAHCN